MIVCTACGMRNEDGESFCADCGAYLEWDGERVGAPGPAAAAPPGPGPQAEETAPGFVSRVKQAVGLGERPPEPAVSDPGASGPAAAGAPPPAAPGGPAAPGTPAAPPAPAGATWAPPPGAVAASAAPPAAAPPAAVLPGQAAPKPRRVDLPPEDRPPAPGETICGRCGAGNAPARKFCRRCGASLADMPVAARLPWWRRLFSRNRVAPVAGTRPRTRAKRSHGKLWTTLIVVAVLVVAGVLTRPYWSPALNEVIDRVKGTTEVNPSAFSASSSAPGHPASYVRDGATNNFWAPAGTPAGQWVEADFPGPFRLVYLRVFNGAADDLYAFLAEPSLQRVSVTYLRKGKAPITRAYTLQDKPGQQQLHVALDDVVGVRVTIGSVYRPASGPLAALGELEFLARA